MTATQSKVDFAHEILRTRIVGSQYAAGQRLIIDNLVKDIGVSQAPLREALRRLEAEGLVEYGTNSGPSIVQLDKTHWFNLMEMKAVMEAYATRAAAPLLSAEEISALRETNGKLMGALDEFDFEAWTTLNRQFHEMIHNRCPNVLLIQELQRLSQWTRLRPRTRHHHSNLGAICGQGNHWLPHTDHRRHRKRRSRRKPRRDKPRTHPGPGTPCPGETQHPQRSLTDSNSRKGGPAP
jgi:DNA-binding GntR family transcriptional regulator